MFLPGNFVPALWSCHNFTDFMLVIICPIISILKVVFNMAFHEKNKILFLPSVYDALKYFTETVTPTTFSKIILFHSFLSYSSFCVNIFSKNYLLFVPRVAMSQLKTLLNIRDFECFSKFFFLEIVLVY